jgi:predicted alpha/beta superfamily hydrolase
VCPRDCRQDAGATWPLLAFLTIAAVFRLTMRTTCNLVRRTTHRPIVLSLVLLYSALGFCAEKPAAVGTLELLTLHSKVFSNTRTIRVWLPPGYYDWSKSASRYPVFYFTDGIATFHGRKLDQVAERLIRRGKIPSTIFVGIDNGGSTLESKAPLSDRANEYLPYPDEFLSPPISDPQGKRFPEFLEREVRPLVESKYRTQGDVGLAGSSYGAAIALYTVMERPGKYRWLLLESPSLYIHNDELLRRAAKFHDWPQRFYVGAGTNEGEADAKREMVDDVRRLVKLLGDRTEACQVIVSGAEHGEDAWRARLPDALEFVLGNSNCPQGKSTASSSGASFRITHPSEIRSLGPFAVVHSTSQRLGLSRAATRTWLALR